MKALLKRKPERRDVIALSVTETAKREYHELIKQATQMGFDLTGSLSTAMEGLISQAKEELQQYAKRQAATNGELTTKV